VALKGQSLHTTLVGLDFHPDIRTGDKSYWLDALPFLAERHTRISVVSSVRGIESRVEDTRQLGDCTVRYVYLPATRMAQATSRKRRHIVHRIRNAVGRTIAAMHMVQETRRIIGDAAHCSRPVGAVHVMDNLGPWTARAMGRLSAVTCISAVSHMGDESALYERYLKGSYGVGQMHVVPYSEAFGAWLRSRGIDGSRIHPIKWGVKVPANPVSVSDRTRAKEALGIPSHHILVLWAGYIQQVGHAELLQSYELAAALTSMRNDVQFFFALKPECFADGTGMPASVPGRITVASTRTQEFHAVLEASDYLLSFTAKPGAIMAPPLTWFEAMGRGVPVVTLAAAGVEEVISPDGPGVAVRSSEDLVPWLLRAKGLSPEELMKCNLRAQQVGSVQTSARRLCELWSSLTTSSANLEHDVKGRSRGLSR
jgi:hypothetical protein